MEQSQPGGGRDDFLYGEAIIDRFQEDPYKLDESSFMGFSNAKLQFER